MPVRLAVVEDHPIMRQGLVTVLGLEPGFEVVGEARSGAEAVELCRRVRPDVALMDLQLPGMDGVEATRRIVGEGLSRVVVLTTFDTEENVVEALRAGAAGFLLKDVDAPELCAVIRKVAGGEAFVQPAVATKYLRLLAKAPPRDPLTPREMEVLRLLSRGLSNREIAAELNVVESTVKNHVTSILAKLEVKNRTSAAAKTRDLLERPRGG